MKASLPEQALQQIFTSARSYHSWSSTSVSDETLQKIYDLMKWGPTAYNACPARIVFIKSNESKQKILGTLKGSNPEQVLSAPVTAVIAYDEKFYDELPFLLPAFDARSAILKNPASVEPTAFRNSSLQGAYFIIAARSLGLDVCPMSGFDNKMLDEVLFQGTSWKSNFICTLGHGDETKLYPRGPRLSFEKAAKII